MVDERDNDERDGKGRGAVMAAREQGKMQRQNRGKAQGEIALGQVDLAWVETGTGRR